MIRKQGFKKRAQVSIEILLIAGIIMLLSVSVFSYYTRIRDSTVAMELIKIKALRQIEEMETLAIVEKIDYRIDRLADTVIFCVSTDPEDPIWDAVEEDALEQTVEDATGFSEGSVDILQNPDPNPCE
jgi:hypothetical protein